ncbi:YraN family protein [Stenotrophomonas sp. SY1]|nr:YraN family protein [Stenotrophomonas sp. SY1]
MPEPSVDLFASVRGKDLSNLTNKEIGDVGEDIARLFLKDNNFTDVFSIQNGSGNGIDIVARSPDGSLVFIEVKTSRTNAVGDLSPRQQSMDFFVEDVLTQAATKTGRYKNISAADQMLAEEMLMNFNMRPDQVRGNVVGIDLSGEMLRISPWARK